MVIVQLWWKSWNRLGRTRVQSWTGMALSSERSRRQSRPGLYRPPLPVEHPAGGHGVHPLPGPPPAAHVAQAAPGGELPEEQALPVLAGPREANPGEPLRTAHRAPTHGIRRKPTPALYRE